MKYIIPESYNYNGNYLNHLLESRGIYDLENFMYPKEKSLLPNECFDNIEKAAHMLIDNINKEILIVVDCDQDGYTSAAITWQYIKDLNPDAKLSYILHSGKQHGLEDTIDRVSASDADLVILPDSSSNDEEYHKRLYEEGKKVLVLDHHEADKYSDYACVVNNQLSENYSNKALSGAGVVYKFCKYLDNKLNKDFADNYLDLAAIGIIGDMMNVTTLENRYIITMGLRHINNRCIESIVEKQAFSIGDTAHITPTAVAFFITPLVNALIRVGKESEKEILFRSLCDGSQMIQSTKRGAAAGAKESLAEQNARNCVNARSRQNRAKEKAIDLLEMEICKNSLDENKIICVEVENDAVDSVLTGLVAMQLMNKYKKPVLVVREDSRGFLKGSARGDSKSELKDLKQFLNDSNYFEYAEGHAMAFGVSIEKNKLDSFMNYANKELKDINFNEGVYTPSFRFLSEDNDLITAITEIGEEPGLWGQGNEEPYFLIENIKLNQDSISVIGKNSDTLKFTYNGVTYLKFNAKNAINDLRDRDSYTLDVIGRANLNKWGGMVSPQIMIEDYNVRDNSILEF